MRIVKERRTYKYFYTNKNGEQCFSYKRVATREFFFDNDEWVCIDLLHEYWEFDRNVDDSYMSGMIEFLGDFVVGFNGCYELPEAVVTCLKIVYKHVDL